MTFTHTHTHICRHGLRTSFTITLRSRPHLGQRAVGSCSFHSPANVPHFFLYKSISRGRFVHLQVCKSAILYKLCCFLTYHFFPISTTIFSIPASLVYPYQPVPGDTWQYDLWSTCCVISRWSDATETVSHHRCMIIIITTIIIIIIIIPRQCLWCCTSSWQSHSESLPGSFDECRTAPSGCRPSDQPRRLGLWVRLYRLPESTPTITIYYYKSAWKLILILPYHGGQKAESTYLAGYIPWWFTRQQMVTHPGTSSSRMCVMTNNWSAMKQHLHPQSVAKITTIQFCQGQDSTMWDIVWVSPQEHRSVSVSCYILLQAPQCPCSVQKRFSID